MDCKFFPMSSLNGTVYLAVLPKENHRERIFEALSLALGRTVTAADLRCSKEFPRPEFPDLHIDANWTHSKNICVLAYSKECRVGVDLEFHSRNRLKLADRFYSVEEVEHLHRLQAEDGEDSALRHFYALWCRKEAFFKCHGGDFFEGTLRRDMQSGLVEGVSLLDLNPKDYDIQGECSLCLATMPIAGG